MPYSSSPGRTRSYHTRASRSSAALLHAWMYRTGAAVHTLDLGQRAFEPHSLLVEQRRVRLVGGREMRVDGAELEVLAREQFGQRPSQVVVPKPEAIHPGIDLEVIRKPPLVLGRRRLHGACGARRGDRRRQPAVEQAVQIADAEGAEDQYVRLHAGGAQLGPFLDIGARQQIGAGVLERARDLAGAVAVRIRLDHRNRARRPGGPFAREVFGDVSEVARDSAQIDAGDGGTDHASPSIIPVVAGLRRV